MRGTNLEFLKKNKIYIVLLLFIISVNIIVVVISNKNGEYKTYEDIEKIFPNTEEIIQIVMENRTLNFILSLFISFLGILTLVGFGVLISLYFAKLKKIELPSKAHIATDINWEIWDVAKIGILLIFIAYILSILHSLFFYEIDISEEYRKFASLFNASILHILSFFILIYFVKIKAKSELITLGLTFKHFLKNIFIGISRYAASIPILVGIFGFSIFISNLLRYSASPQPIFIFFITTKNVNFLIYSIIFVCIIAPIAEETFFRGFAYNAIKKKIGINWAIIISALIFSLLHMNLVGFLPIFFLGMLLAYLYQKTGSLIPSIVTHMLHNSIVVGLILIFREIMLLKPDL